MARSKGTAAARAPGTGRQLASVRPGEEPWSEAELTAAREELGAERTRLTEELAGVRAAIDEAMRGSDSAGDDQADTGSKALGREQELTLLANVRVTLEQTERALARIEDGTYGDCENCGEPIGKLRLQAYPRATLCVTCKQRQERR